MQALYSSSPSIIDLHWGPSISAVQPRHLQVADERYSIGTPSDIRGGSLSERVNRHLPAAAKRARFGIVNVHVRGIEASDKARPLQLVLTLRHRFRLQAISNRLDGVHSMPAAADSYLATNLVGELGSPTHSARWTLWRVEKPLLVGKNGENNGVRAESTAPGVSTNIQ